MWGGVCEYGVCVGVIVCVYTCRSACVSVFVCVRVGVVGKVLIMFR